MTAIEFAKKLLKNWQTIEHAFTLFHIFINAAIYRKGGGDIFSECDLNGLKSSYQSLNYM